MLSPVGMLSSSNWPRGKAVSHRAGTTSDIPGRLIAQMKDFFLQKSKTQGAVESFRIPQIAFNPLTLDPSLKFLGAPLATPHIECRIGFEGSKLNGELV